MRRDKNAPRFSKRIYKTEAKVTLTDAQAAMVDVLRGQCPEPRLVTYPLAAAVLSLTLKQAIVLINRLIRADVLRATGETGRFRWTREGEW